MNNIYHCVNSVFEHKNQHHVCVKDVHDFSELDLAKPVTENNCMNCPYYMSRAKANKQYNRQAK
jgi:hypothetical protein